MIAAFESIKPTGIKVDTDFKEDDKTAKVDEILGVKLPLSSPPDKKVLDLLSAPGKPFTATYYMADLFGAAHRVRLFLPDPISGPSTLKQIQSFQSD